MNKSEDNPVNDGVLYFSQRIDEMLNHSTLHIHKAPLLNTYLLAREYLITSKNVTDKVINETHLKFVYDYSEIGRNKRFRQNKTDALYFAFIGRL